MLLPDKIKVPEPVLVTVTPVPLIGCPKPILPCPVKVRGALLLKMDLYGTDPASKRFQVLPAVTDSKVAPKAVTVIPRPWSLKPTPEYRNVPPFTTSAYEL